MGTLLHPRGHPQCLETQGPGKGCSWRLVGGARGADWGPPVPPVAPQTTTRLLSAGPRLLACTGGLLGGGTGRALRAERAPFPHRGVLKNPVFSKEEMHVSSPNRPVSLVPGAEQGHMLAASLNPKPQITCAVDPALSWKGVHESGGREFPGRHSNTQSVRTSCGRTRGLNNHSLECSRPAASCS